MANYLTFTWDGIGTAAPFPWTPPNYMGGSGAWVGQPNAVPPAARYFTPNQPAPAECLNYMFAQIAQDMVDLQGAIFNRQSAALTFPPAGLPTSPVSGSAAGVSWTWTPGVYPDVGTAVLTLDPLANIASMIYDGCGGGGGGQAGANGLTPETFTAMTQLSLPAPAGGGGGGAPRVRGILPVAGGTVVRVVIGQGGAGGNGAAAAVGADGGSSTISAVPSSGPTVNITLPGGCGAGNANLLPPSSITVAIPAPSPSAIYAGSSPVSVAPGGCGIAGSARPVYFLGGPSYGPSPLGTFLLRLSGTQSEGIAGSNIADIVSGAPGAGGASVVAPGSDYNEIVAWTSYAYGSLSTPGQPSVDGNPGGAPGTIGGNAGQSAIPGYYVPGGAAGGGGGGGAFGPNTGIGFTAGAGGNGGASSGTTGGAGADGNAAGVGTGAGGGGGGSGGWAPTPGAFGPGGYGGSGSVTLAWDLSGRGIF